MDDDDSLFVQPSQQQDPREQARQVFLFLYLRDKGLLNQLLQRFQIFQQHKCVQQIIRQCESTTDDAISVALGMEIPPELKEMLKSREEMPTRAESRLKKEWDYEWLLKELKSNSRLR